jgi:spectinomycin phosphotransferase
VPIAVLEKPQLSEHKISTCLLEDYGIAAAQISFLPLGVDRQAAVYSVTSVAGTAYFLKLRSGPFDEIAVALTKYLADQPIEQVIGPLPTRSGQLWAELDVYKAVLYPFVKGRDGYAAKLSARQWCAFGAALQNIHWLGRPACELSRGTIGGQGSAGMVLTSEQPFALPVSSV